MNPIDIIIVNYKSASCLLLCLESIYASLSGMNAGVFVIDNSPDEDKQCLKKTFPEITLVRNKGNIGFAAAVNKGLAHSTAPNVMLLNPDTLVHAGIFQSVFKYLAAHPEVGAVGPKVLDPDGSVQGSARAFPNFSTGVFGRTSLLSRLFPNNRMTMKNMLCMGPDIPRSVDWVSGACMIVRREVISRVGPMDERFFMYWEDTDWCRRIRENGWQVVYLPEASVRHDVGKSSEKRPISSLYHFHKSAYLLFEKYATWPGSLFNPVVFLALAMRFYFKVFLKLVGR